MMYWFLYNGLIKWIFFFFLTDYFNKFLSIKKAIIFFLNFFIQVTHLRFFFFHVPGEGGPLGPNGDKGSRGRKGQKGDPGGDGSNGEKGAMGPRGYPGYKGDRGDKGQTAKPTRRIAFSASRTTKLGRVMQDTIVTFNNVFVNIGESFDTYTSHFVCQVNGTYLFTAHIMGQNKIDAFAWVMVNNQHQLPLHGDGRAGFGSSSNTIILNLNVEDHVWIQLSKDSALLNDYSTFSGFLIFEN